MKIENLLFLITAAELVAAVAAVACYRKYRASTEKYFLFFLWYTFLLDLSGAIMGHVFDIENLWLYNIFTLTSFLFYFYWYNSILKSRLIRRLIRVFSFLFLIVAIVNFMYQEVNVYHQYTFIVGSVFLIFLTVFHFYQLLNSNQVLVVKYKLSFWISTGLLLFSVGMIPLFSLSEYLNFKGSGFIWTLVSLNMVLYGCYIIGFLWTKKEYNHF